MVGTWRSTSTLHKISSVLFTVFLTVIRDWICHGLLRSFLAPLPSCIIFLCTSGLNFSFMTLFKPVLYCFCCCARLGHKNCINLHLLCKDLAHQLLAVLRASPDSPTVFVERWSGVKENCLSEMLLFPHMIEKLGNNPKNLLWVFPLTFTDREQALLAGVNPL